VGDVDKYALEETMPSERKPGRVLRTQTSKLPVAFTPSQEKAMSEEMLDIFDKVDELDAELDRFKQEMKARKKTREDRLAELRRKMRAGYEHHEVPCEVVLVEDSDPPAVQIVRTDTGEVVSERLATEAECQPPLDGLEPDVDTVEVIDPAPDGAPQLPAPDGEDVIDAEYEDEVFEAGKRAYGLFEAGAPEGEYANPYEKDTESEAQWLRGWQAAKEQAEYAAGYQAAMDAEGLPGGASDAFTRGYEFGAEKRATAGSQPGDGPGEVADQAEEHMTEQVVRQLHEMENETRAEYLKDMEREPVIDVWTRIVGGKPGRKQTKTLVKEILEALRRRDGAHDSD